MKRRNFLSVLVVPFLIPFIGKSKANTIGRDYDVIIDHNGIFTKVHPKLPWITCACGYQHYNKVGDIAELNICPACGSKFYIKFVKCYFTYPKNATITISQV